MTKYYKPREIAELCEVKEATVWSWIRTGKLKAARLGRIYRISQEDFDEFTKTYRNS